MFKNKKVFIVSLVVGMFLSGSLFMAPVSAFIGGQSIIELRQNDIDTNNIEQIDNTDYVRGGVAETPSYSKKAAEHKTDEVIIKFKGENKFRKQRLAKGDTVENVIKKYGKRDDVEYAEPNYFAYAFMIPNDPYYKYQWHLKSIGLERAWNVSSGLGAVVAVIDTGAAYENYTQNKRNKYYRAPDLAGASFAPGYDFVNNDTHPNDDNGHGTHVAGTIAQRTNNALGAAGTAFSATIMPIKVLDKNGAGTYSDVADGIRWAADHGAKVINLSLGGPVPATYLEEAVAYAYGKGVTIVAAAGNNSSSSASYPAAYDAFVIAVGAVRYDKTLAYYSNYGPSIDLVAPGGDTQIDQNNDGYGDGVLQQTFSGAFNRFGYYFYQGTSMAAPHVAGAAALVISKGIATTSDSVRTVLESTADDLGAPGRDDTYGRGLINAAAALGL